MRSLALVFVTLFALACNDDGSTQDMTVGLDPAASTDLAQAVDLAGADLTSIGDGGAIVDLANVDIGSCLTTACTPGAGSAAACMAACGTATATCVGGGGGTHHCAP